MSNNGGPINTFSGCQRLNKSFLSRYERIVVDWFVARMPTCVTPDRLTAIGLFGALVTCVSYGLCVFSDQFLWLASAGLVMHWFGDSLDGSLARFRGIDRPRYGFFIDQNIDVFGNLLIVGGMAASPYIRLESAVLALFGYQALTIYVLVRLNIDGVFRVSVVNSGPTEMRMLIILMNVLILNFGAPEWILFGFSFAWCDITVGLFGLGMLCAFAYLILVEASHLRREDELAGSGSRETDALSDEAEAA